MNSAVINKLIRSEIWPLLRTQGFNRFESRRAHRFGAWRTDVVEFRSFSAREAEAVGVTTFSFRVHVGIFLPGGASDRFLKRDKQGRSLPPEVHCQYRAMMLPKGAGEDPDPQGIFLIDWEGNRTAAVFREVLATLSGVAPDWFREFDSLDRLIGWIDGTIPIPTSHRPRVMQIDGPRLAQGYAVGEALLGRLRQENGQLGEVELEWAAGRVLGFPLILSSGPNAEELLLHVLPDWQRHPEPMELPVPSAAPATVRDFAGLVALRSGREKLTILRVTKQSARIAKLPPSAFYVGIDLYVPKWNPGAAATPTPDPIRVVYWLIPRRSYSEIAPLAFVNIDEAQAVLRDEGAQWLEIMRNPQKLGALLEQSDLAVLRAYPTMRGIGARNSPERERLLRSIEAQT